MQSKATWLRPNSFSRSALTAYATASPASKGYLSTIGCRIFRGKQGIKRRRNSSAELAPTRSSGGRTPGGKRMASDANNPLTHSTLTFTRMTKHSNAAEGGLSLGRLHLGQVTAFWALREHRFKALRCGRRFGKTEFARVWISDGLARGYECAWF